MQFAKKVEKEDISVATIAVEPINFAQINRLPIRATQQEISLFGLQLVEPTIAEIGENSVKE